MHEAALHEENCFITLTYGEQHVPRFLSLRYRDFQLFMKRLRKFANREVRFFMCGEYGGEHSRPHFHACLFGFNFSDLVVLKRGLYRSSALERLWSFGFCSVGAVTFESAAYVARYVMKKVTGEGSGEHYRSVDLLTGEVGSRCPEFCHMSLRPGIGRGWLERFWSDVYPSGKVVVNGVEANPPRYYDRVLRRRDSDASAVIDFERGELAREHFADSSVERLAVREQVLTARISTLKRKI